MKILNISDTHGKHRRIPKEWMIEADVLIHAEDISTIGHLKEIEDFCEWFDKLDYPHKIFIAGNHDWAFYDHPEKALQIVNSYKSITYLQDSFTICDGIKIYGSPHQPEFCGWAFNLKRGNELKEKWDLIPEDIDILITHSPCYGLLDMVPNGEFVGCVDLLDTVTTRLKIKYHVCGHIHCAYGTTYRNGVQFVNASVMNEMYMVVNEPILVEI